jgi:hypothetical protein
MKGLFVNQQAAQCSIYESCHMLYRALSEYADGYNLEYIETSNNNIPRGYDFYIINWHCLTTPYLLADSIRALPRVKISVVLEVFPGGELAFMGEDIRGAFDAFMVLDPTSPRTGNRYPCPRPLEIVDGLLPLLSESIPVIGSFGFATNDKCFDEIVRACGREFPSCIVRVNIPPATYVGNDRGRFNDIVNTMKAATGPGIDLRVTESYMDKPSLIRWCSQNTINVFLYNRNMAGLAAVTDQAVSSGRPLAVSACNTFRHIHPYVGSYPEKSLTELVASSVEGVRRMQEDWHPRKSAEVLKQILKDRGTYGN